MTIADAPQTPDDDGVEFETLRQLSHHAVRRKIRAGRYAGHTAGLGMGFLQGNVAILSADDAFGFLRFCQRNPKPCPLMAVSDTGDPKMFTLGQDIDIRSDVPKYNIYRDGEFAEQRIDVTDFWREDSVAFILGCSFSFEEALVAEGIRLRHIDDNKTVSMYRTSIETCPVGPFGGPLVVSMRPMQPADAIRACTITARFPQAHGKPIHLGDPRQIGIENIERPDWGEPSEFAEGEIPVFWACGVTLQSAIQSAKPPICITHAPGSMLITDIPNWQQVGSIRAI